MAQSRLLPRVLLGRFKYQIDLAGAKNGVNLAYTAPEFFLEDTERVYRNGSRLKRGIGCDYVTSESGGGGTGFDTVTLLQSPLLSYEQFFADYTTDV